MSTTNREPHPTGRAEKAATARRAQAAAERRRTRVAIAAISALAVALAAALVAVVLSNQAPATPPAAVSVSVTADALVMGSDDTADDDSTGDASKDVRKVVVYEDFLCPYCREFEAATRDTLRAAAASGRAVVEYRPFQLLPDPYSGDAMQVFGAVAEHGTAQQALQLHDALFDEQPYEAATDKPSIEELRELAESVGVDDRDALEAMGEKASAYATAAREAAAAAGVQGTPTILVDGEQLQGASVADMAEDLERLLR